MQASSPGGSTDLLSVRDLKKHFPIRSGLLLRQTGTVFALDGVSFSLQKGQALGIVGESGCGKSTLGRTLIRLYEPTAGEITFDGKEASKLAGADLLGFRRRVQMVFQDPYDSLNPRRTIASILGQPLRAHGLDSGINVLRPLVEQVGLAPWALPRYPHEFSGGQRQRIAIARALALRPDLIIADEPVSALDVSVQAQILNLLQDLRRSLGLTLIFIAHDLAVVKHVCDTVAVMYLGRIVESGARDRLFGNPRHPYTQALMAANPVPGRGRRSHRKLLTGDVPSPVKPPTGCHFHPRCPLRKDICSREVPALRNVGSSAEPYFAACHFVTQTQPNS